MHVLVAWDAVDPVTLTVSVHEEERTWLEVQLHLSRLVALGLELELSDGTERDGGDDRVGTQFPLIVGVVADGVMSVPVEV